jgi:hypothetical protein
MRNARAFAQRHQGKVFLNFYSEHQKGAPRWDEKALTITVNRTESLDASHRLVQETEVMLPRECDIVRTFASHLHNTAKKLEENEETGGKRYVYVRLGDQMRYAPIIADFNANRWPEDVFIVSAAYNFESINRGEIYLQRIIELLRPGKSGKKRLFLGGCNKLRGYLRDLPHDAVQTSQIERWPALAALGYAAHTMLVLKPWLRFVKPQKLVSTVPGDDFLTRPQHEQREIMKLPNLVWEEDESDDDGDDALIKTVD